MAVSLLLGSVGVPAPDYAALLEPMAASNNQTVFANKKFVSPTDLATQIFSDDDMPCTYMCDARPLSTVHPGAFTDDEKTYLKTKPIFANINSASQDCPGMFANDSQTKDFSLESLVIPKDKHLIMYGHSYLWEHFHMIRAVQKYMGKQTQEENLSGGKGGCICTGSKHLAEPYCGGSSNFNCDCLKAVRYRYDTGATLTGIFNIMDYQHSSHKADLLQFLQKGVDGVAYSHALVMEPHVDLFFINPVVTVMRTDKVYGCSWGSDLWDTWNTAMPNKVHHVTPWGYSAENMNNISSNSPPQLALAPKAINCTVESQWYNGQTTADMFASGGIQGHQCIAMRDESGMYLGVVASMAADLMAAAFP